MPVIQITNLTANRLPIDSAIGIIPGGGSLTVNIQTCQLEEAGEKLNSLEAAGLISWNPIKSDDVDDKAEFDPISLSGGSRKWTIGTGTPVGNVTGNPGDLYSQTDGAASHVLWVKESGTAKTGWINK
jgi:hypothetical protein